MKSFLKINRLSILSIRAYQPQAMHIYACHFISQTLEVHFFQSRHTDLQICLFNCFLFAFPEEAQS